MDDYYTKSKRPWKPTPSCIIQLKLRQRTATTITITNPGSHQQPDTSDLQLDLLETSNTTTYQTLSIDHERSAAIQKILVLLNHTKRHHYKVDATSV